MVESADTTDDSTFNDIISHPVTANVYIYLRNQKKPVGVREVQRALAISSPSTVHWHLNKLLNNGIINQLQGKKYCVTEPYKHRKSIPLTVTLNNYVVKGQFVPELVVLISFLLSIIVIEMMTILLGYWVQSTFIGLFGLVVAVMLALRLHLRFKIS
ncbi:MAG: winged helix-turn-helix domain-containing protein [Candidatus Odinarchaeota archaeon]